MQQVLIAAVAALVAGAAGYLVAIRSRRHFTASPGAGVAAEAVEAYTRSLDGFAQHVTPVWAAHLRSTREQSETAVNALTMRFAGIVTLLETVLSATGETMGDGELGVFESSRARLGEVISTLDTAIEQKHRALTGLRALIGYSEEMQGMIAEVTRVASQTRLLALNAAIEAQRAGAAGQAFAVVAAEVRDLADLSSTTGTRIGQVVDQVSAAINEAFLAAEQSAVIETTMVQESNAKVQSVLEELLGFVRGLQESSGDLSRTAEGIRDEIAEALVHFQFQDRTGQVLSHLTAAIEALPEALQQTHRGGAEELRPLDYEAMLDELKRGYTMAEELDAHGAPSPADASDDQVTFF